MICSYKYKDIFFYTLIYSHKKIDSDFKKGEKNNDMSMLK